MITLQIKHDKDGKSCIDFFDTIEQKFLGFPFPDYAYVIQEKILPSSLYLTEYSNEHFLCYPKSFCKLGQSVNVEERIRRKNLEIINNIVLRKGHWYQIYYLEKTMHKVFKQEKLKYKEVPLEQWEKKGVPFDGATECYSMHLHFDLMHYAKNAKLLEVSPERVLYLIEKVIKSRSEFRNLKNVYLPQAEKLKENPILGSLNRITQEKISKTRIQKTIQEMSKSNPIFFSDNIPIGQTDDEHEIETENARNEQMWE